MLWAIDVGNTHTVVGLYEDRWRAVWRLASSHDHTEDQLASTLSELCRLSLIPFEASGVMIGSVVPSVNSVWSNLANRWLKQSANFLTSGAEVGLEVTYEPPTAVGADRIANAIAAIDRFGSPAIVIDFGTATTFDVIDPKSRYVGGAIMPGVQISMSALSQRAAKLPSIALEAPNHAIGTNTVDALKAGVMYGYAGSVEAVCARIKVELGQQPHVIATGGLAGSFADLCPSIQSVVHDLTLDGLRLAFRRMFGDS